MNPVRRVLMALDPAAPRPEAFDAIAALFDPAEVELTGLFVEDDALRRLSTLPCALEVRRSGLRRQAFDTNALDAQFAERAAAIRSTFETAARLHRMRAHFLVARGEVLTELRRAASDADVLVVGRSFRSAGTRTWLGAALEQLGAGTDPSTGPVRAHASVLFVHEPWAEGSRVLLVDDGSDAAGVARDQARLLARAQGLALETRHIGEGHAGPLLHAGAPSPARGLEALRGLCRQLDVRVLVLPDSTSIRAAIDVPMLVRDLPASVILTR
jgi:hypothetical protein